ncbi:sensor histidine kinase [Pedobacter nototheniae]|uniref:sensor histidine kinase n=1 Tax=Pedobacter nototheniae TaxID=2488994 RepID=UPI00103B9DD0|nr:sensor histidine kinase [Pedobacter nototheniae]
MSKKHHFDITPHIVKQLGEQLVSDEITALLELIKNSYDADATYVSIEINTTGSYEKEKLFYPAHSGFIIVEDDGFGMSEDTILKSWLLISYSQKRALKEANETTKGGRTPLGEKGLGRLSTQRLADLCEIFTAENGAKGTHIAFDWKEFETKESLSDVEVKVESYNSKRAHGTKIVLGELNHREVWEGDNLENFKGQISQIISPYKENRPFEVYITINGIGVDLDKSNEQLRELAISRFSFDYDGQKISIRGKTKLSKFIGNDFAAYQQLLSVDEGKKFYDFLRVKYPELKAAKEGNFFLEYNSEFKLENIGNLEIIDGARANPGNFYGKIDEFTYDSWLYKITDIENVFDKLSNYREFAQAQAGVKLFRDGFAIKPFGIDGEDWLKLGGEQTGGSSYYGMRPENIIGFINLSEKDNYQLKDKTDREGLISNPYSRNFFLITRFVVAQINSYQAVIRRSYNDFRKAYTVQNNGIKTVKQAFNQLKDAKSKTDAVQSDTKEALVTVNNAINDSNKIVKEVEGSPLFTTDAEKQRMEKVKGILDELLKIQATLQKLAQVVERTEKIGEVIDILEPKIQVLEEQLANFSELAALGLVAESVSHEFSTISDRLAEKASFYTRKHQNKNLSDSDIYVLMEYINSTVNGLKTQLKHLDPSLKYNRENKTGFSLASYFNQEKEYYANRFQRAGILFDVKVIDDFSIKINKGKLTQVVDNIINNSEYWLMQRQKVEKNFKPELQIRIEKPWVYIEDNGYGVAKAIENHIFEPFVTTKPKGQGRGLGLFIIQQLLDAEGCTIGLEPTRNDSGNQYIFSINLSNIMTTL